MARIEVETVTKIVLHPALVRSMHKALQKHGDEFWIRVITGTDGCETFDTNMEVLVQGPDGEEERIYMIRE